MTPEKYRKWLEGIRRKCARCASSMKVKNLDAVMGNGEWPYFECKGPHRKPFLTYGEAF